MLGSAKSVNLAFSILIVLCFQYKLSSVFRLLFGAVMTLVRFLLLSATIAFFLSSSGFASAMMANEFVVRGEYSFVRPRLANWLGVSGLCLSSQKFFHTHSSKGKFILPQIPQHLLDKNQTVKHSSESISLKGVRHYNATDDLFYYELGKYPKVKTKSSDQANVRELGFTIAKERDDEGMDEKLVSKKPYRLVKKLAYTN